MFVMKNDVLLFIWTYLDGIVQDCSNSSVLAKELLQFCAKPSILLLCHLHNMYIYDPCMNEYL